MATVGESIFYRRMLTYVLLLWVIVNPSYCISHFKSNDTYYYAQLIKDIADYYNSRCVYLLTDFKLQDEIALDGLAKCVTMSHKLSANVYSFAQYHQHQAANLIGPCYMPVHVVISLDESTREAFTEYLHYGNLDGSSFSGGGIWLVIMESIDGKYLENYFQEINIPFDMELFVLAPPLKPKIELKEIYRVRKDRPLRSPIFGTWSKAEGLAVPERSELNRRRCDFEGVQLDVIFIENNPFTYKTPGKDLTIGGYLGDIWKVLEDSLNFTSKLVSTTTYGRRNENGSWSGLVGALQSGLYDAGIADLAMSRSRIEVISYSAPLLTTQFDVNYQSMGAALEAEALFSPLDEEMWIALLCWIGLASLGLMVGCHFSDTVFGTHDRYNIHQAFFFVAGALCAQGGVNVPKRSSCRMLYISTFFITAVVFPAYSASLISFLTVLPPHIPFSDLKSFYERGNIRMTMKSSSFEYDMFAYDSGHDPYMRKIFERDIATYPESKFPLTNADGIRNVCADKNLAFLGTLDSMQWIIVQEQRRGSSWICAMAHMPKEIVKFSIALGFPKNSPYRGKINYKLSSLSGRGILRRLRKKHWTIAKPTNTEEYVPVGISNIFMVFVILGSGLIISLTFLALELYSARKTIQPTKKKDVMFHRSKVTRSFAFYHL